MHCLRFAAGVALLAALLSGAARAQSSSESQTVVGQASGTVTPGERSVQASGNLVFPAAPSSPSDQEVYGVSGPTLTITDNTGLREGWSLTMVLVTDFSSGQAWFGRGRLRYRSPGGVQSLSLAQGQPLDPVGGPRELPYAAPGQPLSNVIQVLRAESGFGYGTYVWRPDPGQFRLDIPASTRPGTYNATLQFTVGPRL